jgi:hypothetical protein
MNRPRDRREQFQDTPWQQGQLVVTRSVASMPQAFQDECRERERRMAFAAGGLAGREFLFTFDTAEECAAAVKAHNETLRQRA